MSIFRFMRQPLLALLCCLPLVASAAIYKWVDEQGNTVYSDQPREGAERIELPPPSSLEPLAPTFEQAAPPEQEAHEGEAHEGEAEEDAPMDGSGYSRVAIVSPEQDETIRDNTGTVTVQVELEPPLEVESGHRLVLVLNGVEQPETYTETTVRLTGLVRDSYTLEVHVVDAQGEILAQADPVTFHLKQASRLSPRRRSAPAPS